MYSEIDKFDIISIHFLSQLKTITRRRYGGRRVLRKLARLDDIGALLLLVQMDQPDRQSNKTE